MRQSAEAFTIVETMVAMAIGTIVTLILMYAFTQGIWVFRANETEMWARNDGSEVVRAIRGDLQTAQTVKIYPDYTQTGGTDGSNGSCAVLTIPNLPNAAGTTTYYWRAPVSSGSGPSLGTIYSHSGTSAPNPATDRVLASNITNFEFRRNPNGTVRVGFILAILGYPRRLFGGVEADLLRLSTSALPRNP